VDGAEGEAGSGDAGAVAADADGEVDVVDGGGGEEARGNCEGGEEDEEGRTMNDER